MWLVLLRIHQMLMWLIVVSPIGASLKTHLLMSQTLPRDPVSWCVADSWSSLSCWRRRRRGAMRPDRPCRFNIHTSVSSLGSDITWQTENTQRQPTFLHSCILALKGNRCSCKIGANHTRTASSAAQWYRKTVFCTLTLPLRRPKLWENRVTGVSAVFWWSQIKQHYDLPHKKQ